MGLKGRKRCRLGPLVLNLVSDGLLSWRISSWGLKVGRWSWNSRTERSTVDLPGPWSTSFGGRHRSRRARRGVRA